MTEGVASGSGQPGSEQPSSGQPLSAQQPVAGASNLDEWPGWPDLLSAIHARRCVPFIGAGACAGTLPLGGKLASDLAEAYGYPFPTVDLPRVAQFIAINRRKRRDPRQLVAGLLKREGDPDWTDEDEPHRVIASLPINLCVTTNYDDFMSKAYGLAHREARTVRSYWSREMEGLLSNRKYKPDDPNEVLPDRPLAPTFEKPIVFHIHGRWDDPSSMVLTEDDYLAFLARVKEVGVIPTRVDRAFKSEKLLFLGYSLQDLDLKVLLATIANTHRPGEKQHFSVQLAPEHGKEAPTAEEIERAEHQRLYLEHHFDVRGIQVYWKSCRAFMRELRQRWAAYEVAEARRQ
jgi:hypothetical protein